MYAYLRLAVLFLKNAVRKREVFDPLHFLHLDVSSRTG